MPLIPVKEMPFSLPWKAGGVGLKLTGVRTRLILVDLWWNPAVKDQPLALPIRMGQSIRMPEVSLMIYSRDH